MNNVIIVVLSLYIDTYWKTKYSYYMATYAKSDNTTSTTPLPPQDPPYLLLLLPGQLHLLSLLLQLWGGHLFLLIMGRQKLLPQIDQLTNHGGKLVLLLLQGLRRTWTGSRRKCKRRRGYNLTLQYLVRCRIPCVAHWLEHGINIAWVGYSFPTEFRHTKLWKSSQNHTYPVNMNQQAQNNNK